MLWIYEQQSILPAAFVKLLDIRTIFLQISNSVTLFEESEQDENVIQQQQQQPHHNNNNITTTSLAFWGCKFLGYEKNHLMLKFH